MLKDTVLIQLNKTISIIFPNPPIHPFTKRHQDLESLTLGTHFNQSLVDVTWPASLKSLTFGYYFNTSMEGVQLPLDLEHLKFGASFNQSLKKVILPPKLRSLTLGLFFRQSLTGVTLPPNLQWLELDELIIASVSCKDWENWHAKSGKKVAEILTVDVGVVFGSRNQSVYGIFARIRSENWSLHDVLMELKVTCRMIIQWNSWISKSSVGWSTRNKTRHTYRPIAPVYFSVVQGEKKITNRFLSASAIRWCLKIRQPFYHFHNLNLHSKTAPK